ncbi:MAG: Tar ligand binding domain-containing protein [Burkholderiales bacterium]|nr:Tar ligand binding domain-containing protein [Burkholderiales bacterium]
MLKNLRILHLIMAMLLAFWCAFLLQAGTAWWGLRQSAASLRDLHDVRMAKADALAKVIQATTLNRMEVLLMFQHDPSNALHEVHDHPLAQHQQALKQRQQANAEPWKLIEAPSDDPVEQQLAAEVVTRRKAWVTELNKALQALQEGRYDKDVLAAYLAAGRRENEAFLKSIEALRTHQIDVALSAVARAETANQRSQWLFLGLLLAIAVPGTVVSLAMLRRLRQGFAEADATATAIAEGQLSYPITIDGNDEIGHLLHQMQIMQSRLQALITQVRQAADSIEVAATEVAAGNTDLSHRTEQTASNLQQTASSAEQLGVTVRQNADNAQQANQLAQSASDVAGRGGEVVSQVVGTMREIEGSSRRIADIIGVIDGIAFQTNILALNAAVEAARAGESGRGFAVVAGEVRNLAQRSADAAREIKGLIQASVERVDAGTRQADEAGQTMAEVVQSIRRVTDIVGEISHASQEQSAGVATVGQAVSQMDEATQQNAALVEQSAAAAESLRAQARQLVEAVGAFKL